MWRARARTAAFGAVQSRKQERAQEGRVERWGVHLVHLDLVEERYCFGDDCQERVLVCVALECRPCELQREKWLSAILSASGNGGFTHLQQEDAGISNHHELGIGSEAHNVAHRKRSIDNAFGGSQAAIEV